MAALLAYIELRAGAISRPSRFSIAEARRVADAAGATVYALLAVGNLPQARIDRLASEVSAAGADRILCSAAEAFAGPPLDATHGQLLAQVAERLRPMLFLFPAGGSGTTLGPALAVRIGAAYLANASIQVVPEERDPPPPSQRVILTRWRAARDGVRRIDVGDFERPVVASLSCGLVPDDLGDPSAEVDMLPSPEPGPDGPRLVAAEPDDASTLETCSALLWSAAPIDVGTRAALPDPWPAGVAVADGADALGLEAASPMEVFVLSAGAQAEVVPSALLAPSAVVAQVRRKPGVAS
jgi:hypothetical protein